MTAEVIKFPRGERIRGDSLGQVVAEGLISDSLHERKIAHKSPAQGANHFTLDEGRKAQILSWIDQIRALIEQNRIADFIFVGRDTETRHFLTEIAISASSDPEKVFAFVGITDAMKLELTERALLSPTIRSDGSVLDPHQEVI